MLGINHFENGEPGKFVGEVGITALATLASGGAAAGAKTASGASKVSKVADDVVDAGNAARAADDVSDLQKLGKLDYSDRMAREVPNFAEPRPVPHTGTKPHDELLVNVGDSSRAVGSERSMGWWVPLDEARDAGQRRGVPQRLCAARALEGGRSVPGQGRRGYRAHPGRYGDDAARGDRSGRSPTSPIRDPAAAARSSSRSSTPTGSSRACRWTTS